jgi:hypothetical protein
LQIRNTPLNERGLTFVENQRLNVSQMKGA